MLSSLVASTWTRLFSVLSAAVRAHCWPPAGIALTLLSHRDGNRITSRALDDDTV